VTAGKSLDDFLMNGALARVGWRNTAPMWGAVFAKCCGVFCFSRTRSAQEVPDLL